MLTPETLAALRAQFTFLHDLGIHDFYRRPVSGFSLKRDQPETVEGGQGMLASSPPTLSEPLANRPQTLAAFVEFSEERAQTAAPHPQTVVVPEDPAIAARKRAPISVPPPLILSGMPLAPSERPDALTEIRTEIGDCTRCPLAFAGRHTIVFGDGDPNARLLFVGEGPGADEDASGIPFVGKAGQLLNNMISAMGLRREDVYIANIVKCRPPANRVPEPVEANTCTPFLLQQIGVVRPEVIVALGSTAATYLLGAKSPLSALRGRVHPAYGAKLIVTYHPAYLLRDPRQKKEAWADLQAAMRELAAGL